MNKLLLLIAISTFALSAQASKLICGTKTDYLLTANVMGPRTISNFKMFIWQDNKWVFDGGAAGPFTGTLNKNARNPKWKTAMVYNGLTGNDCIENTCTTLVVPDRLDLLLNKEFGGYAVTKTDQSAGSTNTWCTVR